MTHPPYAFEVITDPKRLTGLKDDWDHLYSRQAAPHLSDSFGWAYLSWTLVTSRRSRRPYCAVVRRDGRAVAILPLLLTPGPLVTVASPMNSESSEYCPCLLDPDEPPATLRAVLRAGLQSRKDVDALRLPHVRPDTPADQLIAEFPGARATIVQPAPVVRACYFPARASYLDWLPADTRASLRRRRRRLDEAGPAEFEEIVTTSARLETLAWVLERKREWLLRRGLINDQLTSKANAEFLSATLRHSWTSGGCTVFALKLDGMLLAAEVVNVDGARVESFTSTYNPAFDKYAPGHLLTLEVIRWALERGLDYDFRPGSEPYKLRWSSHVAEVASYLAPLTMRGRCFVGYRLARRRLAQSAPKALRARASGLARRLWTPR